VRREASRSRDRRRLLDGLTGSGSVSWVEKAETVGALDGLASRRDAELAADRDRLALHGMAGDVQSLANLSERQVGGEEGQESKLGLRER
jgi:hypothetical protein